MNAIGYREFREYFQGSISLAEVEEKIAQNSRNYAKRQLTWFQRYRNFIEN
jgi:tRNA dimethylallyltransferase